MINNSKEDLKKEIQFWRVAMFLRDVGFSDTLIYEYVMWFGYDADGLIAAITAR